MSALSVANDLRALASRVSRLGSVEDSDEFGEIESTLEELEENVSDAEVMQESNNDEDEDEGDEDQAEPDDAA